MSATRRKRQHSEQLVACIPDCGNPICRFLPGRCPLPVPRSRASRGRRQSEIVPLELPGACA
eukprot:12008418-Alexandrium_andersonii.AAC.1